MWRGCFLFAVGCTIFYFKGLPCGRHHHAVTPFYNGRAHLETGVYFATTADGSSACGSAHFILVATAPTTFTLTYSGPLDAREGTVTLTFLKLRRSI